MLNDSKWDISAGRRHAWELLITPKLVIRGAKNKRAVLCLGMGTVLIGRYLDTAAEETGLSMHDHAI